MVDIELYDEPDWRDSPASPTTCVGCGRAFQRTAGEVHFATVAHVPLPDRCRACRPTRRQMREAQR